VEALLSGIGVESRPLGEALATMRVS